MLYALILPLYLDSAANLYAEIPLAAYRRQPLLYMPD
jgi:hypothetical protein